MKKSKGKGSREVGVMDSADVGVRTRAMKAAEAKAKKRKFDFRQELQFSSSRKTIRRRLSDNLKDSGKEVVETSRSSECNSTSRCSSNGLSELVNESLIRSDVDLENESSSCFDCRRRREITPSSNLGEEEDFDDQETMKRRVVVGRRRSRDERISPSEAEIEEFFSKPEKEEQRRFAEKYNYDIVKDVPLKGSYDWVCLKS